VQYGNEEVLLSNQRISGVLVINSLQNSSILGVHRIVCVVEVKVNKLVVTIGLFEVSFPTHKIVRR